jgi:pyruvate/2-oxoglutarate/acetoin dehydrogenase E1 component
MKDTFLASLQNALHRLLANDSSIIVMGEDILDPYGGAFKVTKGLSTSFSNQVITTPISEAGFLGVANGLALRGMKPIAEIMFGDFITLGADQIINYAVKFKGMYQADLDYHYVIRMAVGAGRGYGPTHSQTLEKLYLGIPNLKLIAPSKFHDPGNLLETAINDQGPVLYLEHKLLYSKKIGTNTLNLQSNDEMYPTVKISNTIRPDIDITLITYGGALWVEPLLVRLAEEEIWTEVILPSSINTTTYPLAESSIMRSKHAIVVEEGSWSVWLGCPGSSIINQLMLGNVTQTCKNHHFDEHDHPYRERIRRTIFTQCGIDRRNHL